MTGQFVFWKSTLPPAGMIGTPPDVGTWAIFVISGALAAANGSSLAAGAVAAGASPRTWRAIGETTFLTCAIGLGSDPPGTVLGRHLLPRLDPAGILRCDTVHLGPGAITPLHRHAGPGFRYLIEGALDASVGGQRFAVSPGQAWLERPEDLIIGRARAEGARFVRFMLLPGEYRGCSSFIAEPPGSIAPPFDVAYERLLDEPLAALG